MLLTGSLPDTTQDQLPTAGLSSVDPALSHQSFIKKVLPPPLPHPRSCSQPNLMEANPQRRLPLRIDCQVDNF